MQAAAGPRSERDPEDPDAVAAMFARLDVLERAEALAEAQGLDMVEAIARAEAQTGRAGAHRAAA